MRYFALLILLFTGGLVHAEEYPLIIATSVQEQMNELLRLKTGSREYPEDQLCLIGTVTGKSGMVTGAYRPPQKQTSHEVDPGTCPIDSTGKGPRTIAVWHTHPHGNAVLSGTSKRSPRGGDIAYILQKHWVAFMVVQTDPNRFCWWHRDQVLKLLEKNREHGRPLKDIPFLAPPEGQCVLSATH